MTRPPTERLRRLVDRYVGYRLMGFPAGLHRGLPSRHMTFIADIGRSINVVAQTDPAHTPRRYGCVIGGLQASPALIAHDGDQEGVAIEMTPLGSRALFGMPAGELWNVSVEFADVARAAGSELWERLQVAVGWEERFGVCDEILSRIAREDYVAPELRHGWNALVSSGGQVAVDDLATQTGFSRQHLGRRFRKEFGLTPKLAARVIRFEQARRMLRGVPSFVSLAQVAVTAGYYDQAHLNRDFAELARCTPGELMREEVPFLQEEGTSEES